MEKVRYAEMLPHEIVSRRRKFPAAFVGLGGLEWHGEHQAVGLEINANHLRPVKSGLVTGICKPLHIGAKTHVWEIKIYNDKGKMNCVSRLTVAIISK